MAPNDKPTIKSERKRIREQEMDNLLSGENKPIVYLLPNETWESLKAKEDEVYKEYMKLNSQKASNLESKKFDKEFNELLLNVAKGKKAITEVYKALELTEEEINTKIDPNRSALKLKDAIDFSLKKLQEDIKATETYSSQAKRGVELAAIAVGKCALKIIGAIELVVGGIYMGIGKDAKFGTLGISNVMPGFSDEVMPELAHQYDKNGKMIHRGITKPGGRANILELLGGVAIQTAFILNEESQKTWSPAIRKDESMKKFTDIVKQAKEKKINNLRGH